MNVDRQSPATRPYLSRRARACKQCRAAKVRCSGGRPCERCARRHDSCAFISDENYVSVPEQYLRDLQRQLSRLRSPLQSPTRHRPEQNPEAPQCQPPDATVSVSGPSPNSHSHPSVTAPTTDPTERRALPSSSSISAGLVSPTSWSRQTDVTAPDVSNSRATTSTTPSSTSRRPELTSGSGNLELTARETELSNGDANRPGSSRNILVSNDFAYVQDTHARRLLFLGPTSTWTFCRRAFAVLENAENCPSRPAAPLNLDGAAFRLQWQAKSQVDAGDLLNLPPMDHALFLYNTVKFRLGELFRIFDESRFLRLFEDFHNQPWQTVQAHKMWFVEYLLVLAFGKALTPSRCGPAANGPPGCDLAARALSLLPDVAFLQDERPALQAIEVLSLAALYFYAIDMRSAAYQYIGQALRLALHDGLHRRMPDGVGPGLRALCGNGWWGVYVLDQEITASLGCPSAVPQGDITTPLPDALSSQVSAKALALRTRLSRLVSSISSFTYGLDNNLGGDFIQNTTTVLHSLAELSRDIDEITSAYKTGGGEPPHMFYNITLSHNHCIVLATRPLVIWLLLRSLPPAHFEPQLLTGPMATLLEKSAQSATIILSMLKDLADRDILEGFLPFQLEYAFSSALLLYIISAVVPQFVPSSEWRQAIASVFEAMMRKGSVVAGLRTAELEHLETLLGHHKPPEQIPLSLGSNSQITASGTQKRQSSRELSPSQGKDSQSQHGFAPRREDTRGDIDFFNITAEDMLALAQEFESDDHLSWLIFDERA